MTSTTPRRLSLKTRITVATLLIFLISLWSLTLYSARILRRDMERQLGEQQYSTLALLAAQVDRELALRLAAISRAANLAGPALQSGPQAVQDYVDQRPTLLTLFNGGLVVVDSRGTVRADVPIATGRIGIALGARDSIAAALGRGQAGIGQVVRGIALEAPIFHISAPIRDADGHVIGALSGVTNLGRPSFLDTIATTAYGKSGGYLLVAPGQRLIITASDPRLPMRALPAPGVNAGIDRLNDGGDGHFVFVNPEGDEVLASRRAIAATAWHVAAFLPTAEAFAPIRAMQQHMLWAALLLTLLAGSLTWWMLKRQFAPMSTTIDALCAMTATPTSLPALPVAGNDEIGQLIGAFNGLLATLDVREAALKESEALQGTLLSSLLAGVIIVDPATRVIESVNPAAEAMFGAPAGAIVGQRCHAFLCPAAADACPILDLGGSVESAEKQMICADGSRRTVLKSVTRVRIKGKEKLLECFVDIDERKHAEDEIRQLAFYDPLTRLPNRRLLLDRLRQALSANARHRRAGALFYIDLDNFKALNDTRGHNVGDQLLQQVAQRLVACVRASDTVARFGGDEFVIIVDDLCDTPQDAAVQARVVGEKIRQAMARDFDLGGFAYRCTASIGITLFAGPQQTLDDLLRQADLSMYQAKSDGRNALRFFNQQMQAAISERTALEADLAAALAGGQFALHFQAQVSGRNRLIGAEALLRWYHPRRGVIAPGDFIPLAEESGLILPIGRWVLASACQQLAQWADDPATSQLTLSVNISARQLQQGDFVDEVLAALGASGAEPRRLKLELTESLLVADVEEAIAKMSALKAHGVGFALDDFGTGFSSLTYLKRLPLDQLKIDQSFVRDCLVDANDAAIAKMIVALADSLGLRVIAEGVENEAQRVVLARLGCHDYQGYLFSRPLAARAFAELAQRHSPAPTTATMH